jgi:gluconokinase
MVVMFAVIPKVYEVVIVEFWPHRSISDRASSEICGQPGRGHRDREPRRFEARQTWRVIVVVMGVSGSGKSTVGRLLADRLGAAFVDADDLHPEANVAKMTAGIPLTDEDRRPWLRRVAEAANAEDGPVVIACSALRRAYRDLLTSEADAPLAFVHLNGSPELLAGRLAARTGHFMPPALLDSQLRTLEPLAADEPGFTVDLGADGGEPADIVEAVVAGLSSGR